VEAGEPTCNRIIKLEFEGERTAEWRWIVDILERHKRDFMG